MWSKFISIGCNNKLLNEVGLGIGFSEHYHLSFTPYWQILFQSRKTILMCWLWSKSTIKTKKWSHAIFISKFEHMHINLIFLLLTLNLHLSVGHRIKSTKQLKCTLKNNALSLKHVPVKWVKQHALNNP